MPRKFDGIISLFLATMIYGLYGVFTRFAQADFGPIYLSAARNTIVFIIFLFLARKTWKNIASRDYKWFLLMSVPGLAGMVSTVIAFNHLLLGTAYITIYVGATVGSFLIGSSFFGEKINSIKVISLLICLTGLFFLFSFSFGPKDIPFAMVAIFSGVCAAIWNVFSKKVTNTYSLTQVMLVDAIVCIVFGYPLVFIFGEKIFLPSFSQSWIAVYIFAIFGIFASMLVLRGYRYVQAQVGSLILLIEPAFGALFGFLFFGEIIGLGTMIGGGIILFGSVLATMLADT